MTQPDIIQFLQNRRSSKLAALQEPGPTRDEIRSILQIASRVPDHGKYAPWYFIVFEKDSRLQAGHILREAFAAENPDAPVAKLDLEAEKFMRAPVVIAVISRIKKGKHSQWEQILSSGAACFNLCLSANGLGYGSNWLTEWPAYSPSVKSALGLDQQDHIAGFIYIGTKATDQDERERPEIEHIATWWKPGVLPEKGDQYGNTQAELPKTGFLLT